jgi:hypothetical protein
MTAAQATALAPAQLDRANLYLDQTRNGFIGAIKNLSDAQWSFKPSPNRWSIAEIAEHVLFVHERVLGPTREKLASATPGDTQAIDDFVIYRFADRFTKVTAPQPLNPAGGLSRAQAMERAVVNWDRLRDFLESTPDLREHAIESLPLQLLSGGAFKMMDGYQWILAAAAHSERHTKQILEVIADERFPLK